MQSDEPISAILGSIGAALGATAGTTTAAVVGGAAVASTAASIGTSIASAVKKTPEMKIQAPPSVAQAQQTQGAQVQKIRRGLNYRNTILSGAMDQASSMGKQKLGS